MMLLLPALLSAATLRLDSALTESCAEVGGLRSWLCHLSFDIPDVHLKVDGFNIDLEKTRCGSVLLGELSSSISSAGAPAPTFRLGVQDLGLNCTVGRFSFKYGIIGGSGAATVLLRSATLETGVELELDRDNLAVAAKQIAHPSMVIGEIELELHGVGFRAALGLLLGISSQEVQGIRGCVGRRLVPGDEQAHALLDTVLRREFFLVRQPRDERRAQGRGRVARL